MLEELLADFIVILQGETIGERNYRLFYSGMQGHFPALPHTLCVLCGPNNGCIGGIHYLTVRVYKVLTGP